MINRTDLRRSPLQLINQQGVLQLINQQGFLAMTLPFSFSKASLTLFPSIVHKLLFNSVDRNSLSFTWQFQQICYARSRRKCLLSSPGSSFCLTPSLQKLILAPFLVQFSLAVPDCVLQDQERVFLGGFEKRKSKEQKKWKFFHDLNIMQDYPVRALIDEAAPTIPIPEICLRPISLTTLILRFCRNYLQ